jgi:hypothetical protein
MPPKSQPRPKSTRELIAPHIADIEGELVRRRLHPDLAGGSP